jgi:hypothetical protein
VVKKKVRITDVVDQVHPSPQARASAAKSFAANKDLNIQWQSARNAAIAFFGVAVQAGALTTHSAKGKALESLMIMVDQKTLEYFDQGREVFNTGEAPAGIEG